MNGLGEQLHRECTECGSHDIWDRALFFDDEWNVTTPPAATRTIESIVCYTCKAQQPLGPANDTHAAVDEVRAAELAADHTLAPFIAAVATCGEATFDEVMEEAAESVHAVVLGDAAQVAWLAVCIYTHGRDA